MTDEPEQEGEDNNNTDSVLDIPAFMRKK